jgi:hypothetical protein
MWCVLYSVPCIPIDWASEVSSDACNPAIDLFIITIISDACMHACLLPKLCCHGSSQEDSDPQTTESHFRLACWSHQALLWNITILVAIHDHITIQIEFRHVTVEQLGVADIEPGLIGSPCTSVHGILIFLVHNLSLPVNVHVNRTKFVFPLPHAAAAAQHWKLGAY